jgi:outer membrane protein assembly factor BamB
VEQVWRSLGMKTKFTNVVVRGEHVYGLDEGRLSCMDLASGRRVWKGSRWGHGQVLGVGEHLLLQAEDGEVVILEASPEGERVVGRFPALDGKTWNHPVLAGRHLLVRNDREAVCFLYPEP